MAKRGRPSKFTPSHDAEIYALTCPDTGSIRYIGKAADSSKRYASHMRDARRRNTPVYCWIRSLMEQGKAPGILVLERAVDWIEAERRHISQARAEGVRLLNLAKGGDQPLCSPGVASANARRLNERMKEDGRMARIREIKRALSWAIRTDSLLPETKAKLRLAAAKCQRLFGEYATL